MISKRSRSVMSRVFLAIGVGLLLTNACAASEPYLAVGDFDGDEQDDLVISNGRERLTVLFDYADAGFNSKMNYRMPTHAFGVQAGLFTRDKKVDIAATSDSGLILLKGKGDGTFKSAEAFRFEGVIGDKLEAGDINNDAQSDLVTEKLKVFVSSKERGFGVTSAIEFEGQAGLSALADINGDGNCDLIAPIEHVLPWGAKDEIQVYLGEGDGTFRDEKRHTVPGYGVSLVKTGHFDGDGLVDLVVGATSSHDVTIVFGDEEKLLGERKAVEMPPHKPEFPVYSLGVADFNSDGVTDLAVGSRGCVFIFFGNGDGTFSEPKQIGVGEKPHEIVIGDFDGDGHLDFATANLSTNDISIVFGKGKGNFQKEKRFLGAKDKSE